MYMYLRGYKYVYVYAFTTKSYTLCVWVSVPGLARPECPVSIIFDSAFFFLYVYYMYSFTYVVYVYI